MSCQKISRREAVVMLATGSAAALVGTTGCALLARGTAATDELAGLDLAAASTAVRAGKVSPVQLTEACLDRIDRLDSRLHAFITVSRRPALAEARHAEDEIKKGRWRGPLHGIPVGLKDNIDTAGIRTTAGSAVFGDRVPTEDAEVVERLRAAGAVVLGKQNLHEFAGGTTSAITHFGAVHNPWDLERIAGGSSGGSAAAVAASLCFGSVGTDTGGSIRIPAACCGVVGLKPTFGVISTRGVVPVSNSFDHVGPICRTVKDAALMFRAMTAHRTAALYDPASPLSVAHLRIGIFGRPSSFCDQPIDEEIAAVVGTAVDVMRGMVADVREIEMPMPQGLGRIIDADLFAFHAPHLAQVPDKYDPRTRADFESGRGVAEKEVTILREALRVHRAEIAKSFTHVDLVVLPTLPVLPITIASASEPFSLPACTFAFSLGGLPSMSIPCGFSKHGLPIGILISGPPFSESRILSLAEAYQRATLWHRRRPELLFR